MTHGDSPARFVGWLASPSRIPRRCRMSRCDKASGNSEQKEHRCGSRCYRASPGEIHGRPLPRDSRWRCFRLIASAMSRVAEISPTSLLNIGSQFSAVYFSAMPPRANHRSCSRYPARISTPLVTIIPASLAFVRLPPASRHFFYTLNCTLEIGNACNRGGNPCRTVFCFPSVVRSYSWCLWSGPCSAECSDGEEIRG